MTILDLLNWSTNYLKDHQIENPRLNAELLLAHSLNLSREELYCRFNDPPKEKERERLEGSLKRRVSREPLQYILGRQEFWSIDFRVDPHVLIPRPETELLVEQAFLILSERTKGETPFILEIGTGSGAIAIALAKEVRELFLIATDISREALLLAKENARSAGVFSRIEFINGHLFDPLSDLKGREKFDLILSNPPYIPRQKIQNLAREVRDYEPILALDGGEDGLEFYRRIILQAHFYLKKGGWLILEVGQEQGREVAEGIKREGSFFPPVCLQDLSGTERVVKAQKRGESLEPKA